MTTNNKVVKLSTYREEKIEQDVMERLPGLMEEFLEFFDLKDKIDFDLPFEDFDDDVVHIGEEPGFICYLFGFNNGFGAAVSKNILMETGRQNLWSLEAIYVDEINREVQSAYGLPFIGQNISELQGLLPERVFTLLHLIKDLPTRPLMKDLPHLV